MEQKSIETYFSQYGIEDPDVKMKLIPEINQYVYDRNEAVRKLDDTSLEEYQKQQYIDEVKELEGYIEKEIQKHTSN